MAKVLEFQLLSIKNHHISPKFLGGSIGKDFDAGRDWGQEEKMALRFGLPKSEKAVNLKGNQP